MAKATSERVDIGYMRDADRMAAMSKDPSTKVGAVVVNLRGPMIIGAGCNSISERLVGTDMNNREMKYQRVVHAEMAAILSAGTVWSSAMRWLVGSTLYATHFPCDRCAAHIIYVGVERVVYRQIPERFKESCAAALEMFLEAGVEVLQLEER